MLTFFFFLKTKAFIIFPESFVCLCFYQCFLTGLKSWLSRDKNPEVLPKHCYQTLSDLGQLASQCPDSALRNQRFISGCSSSRAEAPTGGLNGHFTLYLPAVNRRQLLRRVFTLRAQLTDGNAEQAGVSAEGGGQAGEGNTVHVNRGAALTRLVLQSITGNSTVALRSNLSCISHSVVLLLLIRHLTGLHRGTCACMCVYIPSAQWWRGGKKKRNVYLHGFWIFAYFLLVHSRRTSLSVSF